MQLSCFQRVATVWCERSFDGDFFSPEASVISSRRMRAIDREFVVKVLRFGSNVMSGRRSGDALVKEGLI